jgi:MoaE-MoaD fusion protein
MKLTVLLFASLRERAGRGEIVVEDLPEPLDLRALKAELTSRYEELGSLEHVACVIGTEYVSDETAVQEGDEVALLPPVSGGEMTEDERLARGVFQLETEPLDPEAIRRRVEHDSCGAVVLFSGNVRETNRDQSVERIDYEAFERMAGPEMERIFEACLRRHGGDAVDVASPLRIFCVHRIGTVAVGESSVLIAVASPHREAAFDAARFLIDELKKSLPVWKKEVYADGHHWIGDRS